MQCVMRSVSANYSALCAVDLADDDDDDDDGKTRWNTIVETQWNPDDDFELMMYLHSKHRVYATRLREK